MKAIDRASFSSSRKCDIILLKPNDVRTVLQNVHEATGNARASITCTDTTGNWFYARNLMHLVVLRLAVESYTQVPQWLSKQLDSTDHDLLPCLSK